MARRKRQSSTFNLSFLDIMSCGFGAVVLVFLAIDRSIEIEIQEVNATALSEVNFLEQVNEEGRKNLASLTNAKRKTDREFEEAMGLARRINEDIENLRAEIEAVEKSDVSNEEAVDKLKAKKSRLEDEIRRLNEAAEAANTAGRNVRSFRGDGNRQYLTGLNLAGQRTVILVDTSASMLANELVNVVRLRYMDPERQKLASKWTRTLGTVDWLLAQLPVNSQFQVITFNTEAQAALQDTEGQWVELADTQKLEAISEALHQMVPANGTSLHNAFASLQQFTPAPDNIILITDGLPTQGTSRPSDRYVTPAQRKKLFAQARKIALPSGIPVNIILMPMDGDAEAAWEFWRLAVETRGSLLAPSSDWP